MTKKEEYNRIYKIGYDNARKEILDFIETERDNGNIEGEEGFKGTAFEGSKGFSASLCLSKLIRMLEKK